MKNIKVIIWVFILFVIDLLIKILIEKYYKDVNFEILPSLLSFKPSFNYQYSWINSLFQIELGFWSHFISFSFVGIFIIWFYYVMKTISDNNMLINISFIFCFAGFLSAYFGLIFWNGCIDYIYLKPLFVFDLKDLYISTFSILLLLYYFKNRKYLSSIKKKYS